MLAISLVYDLRLFKPSTPDVQLIVGLTQGYSEGGKNQETSILGGEALQGILEQQKAVLACFVLSSKYAIVPTHEIDFAKTADRAAFRRIFGV